MPMIHGVFLCVYKVWDFGQGTFLVVSGCLITSLPMAEKVYEFLAYETYTLFVINDTGFSVLFYPHVHC